MSKHSRRTQLPNQELFKLLTYSAATGLKLNGESLIDIWLAFFFPSINDFVVAGENLVPEPPVQVQKTSQRKGNGRTKPT